MSFLLIKTNLKWQIIRAFEYSSDFMTWGWSIVSHPPQPKSFSYLEPHLKTKLKMTTSEHKLQKVWLNGEWFLLSRKPKVQSKIRLLVISTHLRHVSFRLRIQSISNDYASVIYNCCTSVITTSFDSKYQTTLWASVGVCLCDYFRWIWMQRNAARTWPVRSVDILWVQAQPLFDF